MHFFLHMSKKSSTFVPEMRKIYLILFLSVLTLSAVSETRWDHITMRHEIRVGWGDQLFESLMWHNPTHITSTMPATYSEQYKENFHHYQHYWIEYQYRFAHWFGLGVMLDGSGVQWDDVVRDGQGVEISRVPNQNFYNLVLMPTVRFTYFHHEYVNIYSGFGFGLDVNGGTETNAQGKKTDIGAAFDITVIGVSANYHRWFWTVDFGGLYALKNANVIFMAGSRMINVGLGARF